MKTFENKGILTTPNAMGWNVTVKTPADFQNTNKINGFEHVSYGIALKFILKAGLVMLLLHSVVVQGATIATNIAAGDRDSLFLKSDGSLWTMGYNNYGQLGDGTFNNTNRPERIITTNVLAVACGDDHSLLLKTNGSLWAMGYNVDGELGDGTFNTSSRPKQIVSSNVVAIACGVSHSLFTRIDGSLWAMGYNGDGELGDGTFNNTNRPEQIVSNSVVAIASRGFHSLFLKIGRQPLGHGV